MKLKKLLKVIPENYDIGLTYADNRLCFITYATKKEGVMSFAKKTSTTIDYVEDLDVVAIHPCARTYCTDENVFGDGMPSLHVESRFLIELEQKVKEGENNG